MKKGMKYLCSLKDNRTVTKVSENLCIPKLNLGLTEQHSLCAGRLVFMLLNFECVSQVYVKGNSRVLYLVHIM
jgi:hypothetical protein